MLKKLLQSMLILLYKLILLPTKWGQSYNVLEIKLKGMVAEEVPPFGMFSRFAPRITIFRNLLATLQNAEEDTAIKALILYIGNHDMGWAKSQELRDAIKRFRESGKKAYAYLESGGNIDFLIASECDRIVLAPSGNLDVKGLLSEVVFFKDTLDRLDIKPNMLQAGKYKSAVEPYIRSSMSKEHRENLNSLLDSMFDQLVEAIADGRSIEPATVKKIIDEGPYLAEPALSKGLIDDILYPDQIEKDMEEFIKTKPKYVPMARYQRLRFPNPRISDPFRDPPQLALIYATGMIHSGESKRTTGLTSSTGSDTLTQALRKVRENKELKAAVLRVDSPGGSGLASDMIWREVSLFKGVKPIVVSMGDTAASGGYYIAMAADHIVALPGTATGSIGVIGGKVNMKGLFEKLGLKKEFITRGKHADLHSNYSSFSKSGQKKVNAEIENFYNTFVQKAAEGRRMGAKEMDNLAQGRVWSGRQAMENGLIDETGGLHHAIEVAKQKAGISKKQKALIDIYPRPKRMIRPLLSLRALPWPFSIISGLEKLFFRI
ncbi:MAG: signal peptide peptidase SppA [Desulfobacterales bacterium]|nr:signal peptide peptidase SppA [Desulfobacterales bacterium]